MLLVGCPGWTPAQWERSPSGLWCPAHVHPGDGAGQGARVGSPELWGGSCQHCWALPSQSESPVTSRAAGAGSLQKRRSQPWLVPACGRAASSPRTGLWRLRSDVPHGYAVISYSKRPGSAIALPRCKHRPAAPREQRCLPGDAVAPSPGWQVTIFSCFPSLVHLLILQFAAVISEAVFNHSQQGC